MFRITATFPYKRKQIGSKIMGKKHIHRPPSTKKIHVKETASKLSQFTTKPQTLDPCRNPPVWLVKKGLPTKQPDKSINCQTLTHFTSSSIYIFIDFFFLNWNGHQIVLPFLQQVYMFSWLLGRFIDQGVIVSEPSIYIYIHLQFIHTNDGQSPTLAMLGHAGQSLVNIFAQLYKFRLVHNLANYWMKFIIPVQQQIGIAYLVDFVNPFKPYNI